MWSQASISTGDYGRCITQPGHPTVGRCNEYWQWFQPLIEKNGEFCIAEVSVSKTGDILKSVESVEF